MDWWLCTTYFTKTHEMRWSKPIGHEWKSYGRMPMPRPKAIPHSHTCPPYAPCKVRRVYPWWSCPLRPRPPSNRLPCYLPHRTPHKYQGSDNRAQHKTNVHLRLHHSRWWWWLTMGIITVYNTQGVTQSKPHRHLCLTVRCLLVITTIIIHLVIKWISIIDKIQIKEIIIIIVIIIITRSSSRNRRMYHHRQ